MKKTSIEDLKYLYNKYRKEDSIELNGLRKVIASNVNADEDLLIRCLSDSSFNVRALAALNPSATEKVLVLALKDTYVSDYAVDNVNMTRKLLNLAYKIGNYEAKLKALSNPNISAKVLEDASKRSSSFEMAVAKNPAIPLKILRSYLFKYDDLVELALKNPRFSELKYDSEYVSFLQKKHKQRLHF